MKKNTLLKIGAVLIALIIWQIVSMLVGMEMLLASPIKVLLRIFTLITEKSFFPTLFYSLLRIMFGFLIAFSAGVILAILSGRFGIIEILLRPYVITAKSVPVASFIILCLIWFSYTQLTVFITFLIAFPVIYTNVLQGIKSTDRKMTEMASLFKIKWFSQLLYIYLPALKPYLISACGVATGMAWKAGIAAEVIGMVNGSVGERLYEAKIYFSNADLLAWTVVIILMSIATEKAVSLLLKLIFKGVERL